MQIHGVIERGPDGVPGTGEKRIRGEEEKVKK